MLAVALVIDALAGERMWERPGLLHPVVLIGRLIGWLEARLNRGLRRRAAVFERGGPERDCNHIPLLG
jgi:adenosylcobinamide-phosphate synthase